MERDPMLIWVFVAVALLFLYIPYMMTPSYTVQHLEVVDTVYADIKYDTVYVATNYFDNARVNIIYGSQFGGPLYILADSTVGTMGSSISYCDFRMECAHPYNSGIGGSLVSMGHYGRLKGQLAKQTIKDLRMVGKETDEYCGQQCHGKE